MRSGFEPDSLIGKAINTMTKAAHLIKDKWNYIVNYEAYLTTQKLNSQTYQHQKMRTMAHQIAKVLDEAADLRKQFRRIDKEAVHLGIKQSEHPHFEALYQRSIERDKNAAFIVKEQQVMEQSKLASKQLEALKPYAERYERYQTVALLAQIPLKEKPPEHLTAQATLIDIQKDRYTIHSLAKAHNKTPEHFIVQIKQAQRHHQEKAWGHLCKNHPILAQYEQLNVQCTKQQGHKGQQYHQNLQKLAITITANKELMNTLQKTLPKVAKTIQERALHQREQGRSL